MSNKLIELLVKIFSWTLMGVSIIVALVYFFRISGAEAEQEMVVAEPYILWALILLGLTAFLAIIFPIIYFVLNPRNAVKALVGLLGLGLVFLIGYLSSDTSPIDSAVSNPDFSDPAVLRFADTGIIATYILLGFAILSLIFTGVRSIIKL
ncbi:MAG: hypothetical protein ACLFNU_06630 [Bacteroidales bacterium]